MKNHDEICFYEKNGKKYLGYYSHPYLSDSDGDGISDSAELAEGSASLLWDIFSRDAAMFIEIVYCDDYVKKY